MKFNYCAVLLSLVLVEAPLVADLNPMLISEWPGGPTGWLGAVAVNGNYAYVGTGSRGCYVLDMTDPSVPRRVGTSAYPMSTVREFSGKYAYALNSRTGLEVFDLSDPVNPRRVGWLDSNGSVLAMAGHYAYLLEPAPTDPDKCLLRTIDVSDPAHLLEVGASTLSVKAVRRVLVSGNYAFVFGWIRDPSDTWTVDCLDISNPSQVRQIGHCQRAGYVGGSEYSPYMALSGNYLYISADRTDINAGGVQVVDVSDPANPHWVAAYENNQYAGDLFIYGNYLLLGRTSTTGQLGIDILDISNPLSLRRVASYAGELSALTVSGIRAYLAINGHFEILNLANPASPQLIGSWMPPVGATDLAHAGNLTCVVGPIGTTTYLNVLYTTDPANPQTLGSLSVPGWTQRLKLLGNYAYIVTEDFLTVVDITNPSSPKKTRLLPSQQAFADVAFAGDYAFLADREAGVQLLTVTNRAFPRLLKTLFANSMQPAVGVCVASNTLYISRQSWQGSIDTWYGTVEIIDITNPQDPAQLSSYQTTGVLNRSTASGRYLYLTKRYFQNPAQYWWGGILEIIDLADPYNPQLVSQFKTTGEAYDVTVLGNRAYIACNGPAGLPWEDGRANANAGVNVIDLSDPVHPRRVGGFQGASPLVAITVDGDRAYTPGGWYGGLQIIDLSRSATFSRIAELDTADQASGLSLAANHLFVADRFGGLQVVDVSNPAIPSLSATITSTQAFWGTAVSGSTLFAANGEGGVRSFDITDPANPQPLGVYATPSVARGVTVSGHYCYIADGYAGLEILDVSNPLNLRHVGSVDTKGLANSVTLMGNNVLVADWTHGLVVIDISNPQSPHIVGSYNQGGCILAVAVTGTNAVVSDGFAGFQVLDLSNPAEPKLLGRAPANGWARSIAISGRFAYVADAFAGVQVYDISDLAQPRRLGGTAAVDPYGFVLTSDHLFVAGGRNGITVLNPFSPPLDLAAVPSQVSGTIRLRLDGPAGSSVRLQRSSDLSHWQDWQSMTLGDQPAIVTDPAAQSPGQLFYRIAP